MLRKRLLLVVDVSYENKAYPKCKFSRTFRFLGPKWDWCSIMLGLWCGVETIFFKSFVHPVASSLAYSKKYLEKV